MCLSKYVDNNKTPCFERFKSAICSSSFNWRNVFVEIPDLTQYARKRIVGNLYNTHASLLFYKMSSMSSNIFFPLNASSKVVDTTAL